MKTVKIDGVELTEEQIRKAYKELEEEKDFPQKGEEYWFIDCEGEIFSDVWDDATDDDLLRIRRTIEKIYLFNVVPYEQKQQNIITSPRS